MAEKLFNIGEPFMEGISSKKRADILDRLDAVAYRQKEGNFTRMLTPEELSQAKSQLAESCIKLASIEEEKKEIMDEFKQRIKDEKLVQSEYLTQVKFGSVNVEGRLFEIDNQQAGIMFVFDERGICVAQRGLLPEERQGVIRMNAKASGAE